MRRALETLNYSVNASHCTSTQIVPAPPIRSAASPASLAFAPERTVETDLLAESYQPLILLSQTLDGKPHPVPGFQELRRFHSETDTRWGARRDDVAREQRHEMADIADDMVDPEDQVGGVAVLHPLAVDFGP